MEQGYAVRKVITYGTFDTLHFGHIRLLRRARALGDHLIVGLSTDAFNSQKGKAALHSWSERRYYLESISCVNQIIPEESWDQKENDIISLGVAVFVMGDDWRGRFDNLSGICEVIYLPRTLHISSTQIRQSRGAQ